MNQTGAGFCRNPAPVFNVLSDWEIDKSDLVCDTSYKMFVFNIRNNYLHNVCTGGAVLLSNDLSKRIDEKEPVELTTESVLYLWSKTYNTNGKPDWSHIYPYYHPDIVFMDSIQRIDGIDDFTAMCRRLTKRCKQLRMDINSIVQDSNIIMMDWKMTMSFRKSPSTPIFGCTKLTLHEDGRIIEQRDYYDLWGDIYNGIPGFRRIYRSFMRKFFG